MIQSHPEDHNSASRSAESHHDGSTGDDGELPPEPSPNHPRHDPEGACRVYRRLDDRHETLKDLSAYELRLIAYWDPDDLFGDGSTGGTYD